MMIKTEMDNFEMISQKVLAKVDYAPLSPTPSHHRHPDALTTAALMTAAARVSGS